MISKSNPDSMDDGGARPVRVGGVHYPGLRCIDAMGRYVFLYSYTFVFRLIDIAGLSTALSIYQVVESVSPFLSSAMPLGPRARLWMPVIGTSVAVTALVFQTCVLYPWHHQLDSEMQTMREEQKNMLKMYHESKLKRIDELERRIVKQEERRQDDGM